MQYEYTGEADRYYPTLALTPKSGEVYDLESDPGDDRWKSVGWVHNDNLADVPAESKDES